MMQISENGIGLIMELEGFKTVSYQCSADIWTYGYGSTTTLGGSKVTQGMSITQRIAEKLMQRNIAFFAAQVNRLIRVDLTQN